MNMLVRIVVSLVLAPLFLAVLLVCPVVVPAVMVAGARSAMASLAALMQPEEVAPFQSAPEWVWVAPMMTLDWGMPSSDLMESRSLSATASLQAMASTVKIRNVSAPCFSATQVA